MKKALLLIVPVFLLASCITTNTTSFVDPNYKLGTYKIRKVVVKADSTSLEEILLAENALTEKFKSLRVDAIKYVDLIPPTRNYSDKETAKIIASTGADSLFIIIAGTKSEVESYVPPTYHPGTSTSYISGYGNFATVNTYTNPGYTSGGYTTSSPIMATKSFLIDLKNANTIWQAESVASGDGLFSNTYTDLLIGAGTDAIEDLKVKSFITEVDISEKKLKTIR